MADFVSTFAGDAAFIVGEQATGQTVSYTAFGANPANISAVWDPLAQEPSTERDTRHELRRGVLQTLPSETPAPDTRDVFVIGGATFAVESVERDEWVVEWNLIEFVPHRFGGAESHVER